MKGLMKRLWIPGAVVGLALLDLSLVEESEGNRAQLLPAVDTAMLGEATVAVACSECEALARPAARDARLDYAQVDAVVRRAIALDDSPGNLAAVVEEGDWVAIKVNIVTAPLVFNGRRRTSFWDQGRPHWGQVTDLRVVKSVIDYLVREEGDARRITIVEGGAEWAKLGEPGTDPAQTEDGWTVRWEAFDNLSYADIVEEYDGVNGVEVDIVDLNYDEWVGTEGVGAGDPLPVPDPNHSGIGWLQRPEGYYVSRTLLEVDKLVNIAAMKTHDIPGVTLLHKQYVGTFMQRAYGARNNSKMDLHRYGNERVPWGFMDMFSYRPTDYGIVEGFWGTEGRGPQWGNDVNHNVVVAGSDPVAVDAVAASVMGYNPEDLVFLRLSAAKGFGTYDLDRIQIRGDDADAVRRDFDKTPNPDFWGWGNRRWLVNGPYASADIEEAPIEGEAALEPAEGQEHNGIAWRAVEGAERFVRLPEAYSQARSTTYAFAYIASPVEQEGFLYLGADDGCKVWLNGREVVAKERAGTRPDAIAAPVTLGRGLNPVVVKVRNGFGAVGLSLVAGDRDGDTLPGIEYFIQAPPAGTAVGEAAGGPEAFGLGANYPNPFNASTFISYRTAGHGAVKLEVYDTRGALVRRLVDRSLPGGAHLTRWDGRDAAGAPSASGLYFYRLSVPGRTAAGKMMLVR